MASSLVAEVRALVSRAAGELTGSEGVDVETIARRLDEPLRVAIAGRVKAGKSTLLNALVAEALAPTDAGECTRIVTWYRHGPYYRVTLVPTDGAAAEVPFSRTEGALAINVRGTNVEAIDHLEVEWPARALEALTLVDTPGLASATPALAARTWSFLAKSEAAPDVDAVIYLVRHLHPGDVDFLEAFRVAMPGGVAPVNAVGVLSRADEIGGGRVDALAAADHVAEQSANDPSFRRVCQGVVPIAGLLAQAGRTLREEEYVALRALASEPAARRDRLLLSADHFVSESTASGMSAETRTRLLARLGLFGVRLALELIDSGRAPAAPALAEALVQESGLPRLHTMLRTAFAARAEVLKARSAMASLQSVLQRSRVPVRGDLLSELERIEAGAHELTELDVVVALRQGEVSVTDEERAEVVRILGGTGTEPTERLGLDAGTGADEVRQAALDALVRWRRRAENPLAESAVVDVVRAVVRTCEGLVAEVLSSR